MKFLLAILVFLAIGAALSWGIILTMHGKPLALIITVLAFVFVFGKVGCKSH